MSNKKLEKQDNDTETDNDLATVSQKAWNVVELKRRCEKKTLFKSKDCNEAKIMLDSFKETDEDHVKVGTPETIENEEQLKFVRLVHQKINEKEKANNNFKR